MKKNNFEKMCDDLEKCSRYCEYNEVVCAIKYLHNYCKGDRNRLLQIKAEANGVSYQAMVSFIFNALAMFATVSALLLTLVTTINLALFKNNMVGIPLIVTIDFLFLIYLPIYGCWIIRKYRNVNKWHKYILVAIEELNSRKKYRKVK